MTEMQRDCGREFLLMQYMKIANKRSNRLRALVMTEDIYQNII